MWDLCKVAPQLVQERYRPTPGPSMDPERSLKMAQTGGWDNSSAEEPPWIETRGLVTELVSETGKQRSEAGTPKTAREARHSHASEYRVSDT